MFEHDRYFELVDTGGIGFDDPDNLTAKIEEQIDTAIESADVILFVVDTRDRADRRSTRKSPAGCATSTCR